MPKTLTLGPGDHFDFVRIHAGSKCGVKDLLTTQSEEEPLILRIRPQRFQYVARALNLRMSS